MNSVEPMADPVAGPDGAPRVEGSSGLVSPGLDSSGRTTERSCLNCGTALLGDHCHACGQRAHVPRSLLAFGSDFLQGLFNFEGKFWRTLPMLLWRPGEMTRRYISGERGRFISPVALFLFTVFLMFAVLSFNGALDARMNGNFSTEIGSSVSKDRSALADLEAKRARLVAARQDVTAIDRKLVELSSEIEKAQALQRGEFSDLKNFDGQPAMIRSAIRRFEQDPNAVIRDILNATSKFSWLLIPISVPFVWLLFPFRRTTRLYDHTVFVTYSISFMMLLVVAGGLLVAGGLSGWAAMLTLAVPVHMYRQLRGAYRLRWWSALIRTALLLAFALVSATLFALGMIAIGVF